MNIQDLTSTIASIVGIIAFIVGLFQYTREQKRSNQRATMEEYQKLQRDVFDEINKLSLAEIREAVKHNRSDTYKDLSAMLARIELFCIGINKKIYDFETFYSVAHGYFDGGTLYQRIEPLLENKMSRSEDLYYQGIDTVLKKMQKRSGRRRELWRNISNSKHEE